MTYNGFQNYETWLANIHFDSWDFSEYTDQIIETEDPQDELDVRNWIEEFIKAQIQETTYDQIDTWNNPWLSDLVTAAMSEIDYRDLAEHYSEEVWEAVKERRAEEAPMEALTP